MDKTRFEWNEVKDRRNQQKHGVPFLLAQYVFADFNRVILKDEGHSAKEPRFYCLGQVGGGVLTVRFTYRDNVIRICGAGYWRKGKTIYEKQNQIHE